jgi:hypothetical protein
LAIVVKLNERSEYDVLSVESKRDSEATVSMTLPSPSRAVAHNTPRPSALLGLSNELLFKIAGKTAEGDGRGVNLNLRLVSKQMKLIADDQMSSKQFVVTNGQTLQASGHSPTDMLYLAGRQDRRDFVVTNGQTLQASGHNPTDMSYLAGKPENERNAVLQQIDHPN